MNREEIKIKNKQLEEISELERVVDGLDHTREAKIKFKEGWTQQNIEFEISGDFLDELRRILAEELLYKKKEYEIE